ncbi:nitroreductase family deazaflavin-dependent oxidoreductase [Nocardia vinacea]|uniref:Nitroreductase family deazaflavin-dependent oxidoreductase n=1 Tax=Nocardia vinacea TaxID=96468 RepID=A0ABZ1YPZ8_9NOCA|nr:nitroreductase family deazaflavin-dependent oxidoreductase [Nocardia vinacea]
MCSTGFRIDPPRKSCTISIASAPSWPPWICRSRKAVIPIADPLAHVRIRAARHTVCARIADTEERQRLWLPLTELYADFDTYQSWTRREIPVVILSCMTR